MEFHQQFVQRSADFYLMELVDELFEKFGIFLSELSGMSEWRLQIIDEDFLQDHEVDFGAFGWFDLWAVEGQQQVQVADVDLLL